MTTTTSEDKLSMKLFIDTKAGKVLFAEAGKDCVDFLFHILSLHVTDVIMLLKEKRMDWCLPNLYDSVENLNSNYTQSNHNKDILLKPSSSIAGIYSPPFPLLDYVPTQRPSYACSRPSCSYYSSHVTVDPKTWCGYCDNPMSRMLTNVAPVGTTVGFVKEALTYMVMDDLMVKPLSTITLLNEFDLKDVGLLQEQVVTFGKEEAMKLLKASFESKTVLTSVFMSRVKEEK